MTINRAEQTLQDRLVVEVNQLKRDMRDIKSRQPVGSDILQVVPNPEAGYVLAGPVTLAANASATFIVTSTAASQVLTLWNFLDTIYVDVNDTDHSHPNGSALSAGQRELYKSSWIDFGDSSDSTNARVYKIRIKNWDVVPHDYYLHVRSYLPTATAASS